RDRRRRRGHRIGARIQPRPAWPELLLRVLRRPRRFARIHSPGGIILQCQEGHSQLSTAKSGSTVRLADWRNPAGITQKAAPSGKIGATAFGGWCQPDEAMMTTELLDDCGEHPAFGALLGEGAGIEHNRGTRFVVV